MKRAIISDIHSNIEALDKVLAWIEREKITDIICLGDLVGYGPDPQKCIERVHHVARVILAGNHDYAAVGMTDTSYFNLYARLAADWTGTVLSKDEKSRLSSAPLTEVNGAYMYVHATPCEPETWDYIMSTEDAELNFRYFDNQVCFIGHSHVPMIMESNSEGKCMPLDSTTVTLKPDSRYIINVGSVGQPRDHDTRACFGVFDDEEKKFEIIRIEYPFPITQRKIRKLRLPDYLADRLGRGA